MSKPSISGLNTMLARYASKRFVFGLALAYLVVFVVWAQVDDDLSTKMQSMVDSGVLVKEVFWYRVYVASWAMLSLAALGVANAMSLGMQNWARGESHIQPNPPTSTDGT